MKKTLLHFLLTSIVLMGGVIFNLSSCNKAPATDITDEVCFGLAADSSFNAESVTTKAVAATGITSFKCEATKGAAGSETESSWNNIVFTTDGAPSATYTASPKKYWPLENPSYNIYAVAATSDAAGAVAAAAPDLAFVAGGSTITMAAAYNKDVVCAYEPTADITFKSKNNLAFEHIFARISTVTVTALAPCSISNITINLVDPKTGGTYNLRTGAGQIDDSGWSSLVPASGSQQLYRNAGSIAAGANNTGSNNDFYIVPGDYQLQATWTASVDDYTQTYEEMASTDVITIQKGKINSISCVLSGDPTEIKFSVSIAPWGNNAIADVEFEHPLPPPSFGGLEIAPGNLYYDGTNWSIDSSWDEHCTYNTAYGVNSGTASTYFSFNQMGALFEKAGFSNSDGDIENLLNPLDGWRLPTRAEWATITTGDSPGMSREGSIVNGVDNAKYALIRFEYDVTFNGCHAPEGLLLFPDGRSISGKMLSGINNLTKTINVTISELQVYLNQGCRFLPLRGFYSYSSWNLYECRIGYYPSANSASNAYPYGLQIYDDSSMKKIDPNYVMGPKYQEYYLVRLVRDAE